ncbi:hypothetical protein THAOC_09802, partial [Thalassiosira oceanica]
MSANIQTIANAHMNLISAKGEVASAKQDYDAAKAETIAKQAANNSAPATTSDSDKGVLLQELVDAMAAETAALLVLRAKEDQVAQLQTALSLQEQLARDSGKIQTAFDLQSGAVSVPMDANFINGLGFEATQVHTERTVKHPIVYSQNKRDDPKTKKAMYEAVEVSWSNKKLLSVGYSTEDQANAGYTATQYVSNGKSIQDNLIPELYTYDLGDYIRFHLPGDPTNPDPKQAFAGGTSVSLFSETGVATVAAVATSARFMHNWTKTGDVDNLLLEKITRKVCDDRLFAAVKAKYDKLDESHRYGQVMLFLAIQEALLLDETTLKTMEDWVQRDDLCQLFGGDLKSLIEVIESVLTVLLKYGRFPHQLAKHFLTQFSKHSCEDFAAPFRSMLSDYVTAHALEEKVLGSQSSAVATKHYNESIEVLEFAQKLYNNVVTTGKLIGQGEKPTDGALNAFTGGGDDDDDDWKASWRWYKKGEYDSLSASRKKKVRDLFNEKGVPPDAPESFRKRFEEAKRKGGYQRKTTWTDKAPGRNSKTARTLRSNGGAAMIDGKLLLWCKGCGVNDSHSSGGHDKWERNPGAYCLPANHPGKALQLKHLGGASNSNGSEPSAGLRAELKEMKSAFKAIAKLSADVLEAEAKEDPDPAGAQKRRELVNAWQKNSLEGGGVIEVIGNQALTTMSSVWSAVSSLWGGGVPSCGLGPLRLCLFGVEAQFSTGGWNSIFVIGLLLFGCIRAGLHLFGFTHPNRYSPQKKRKKKRGKCNRRKRERKFHRRRLHVNLVKRCRRRVGNWPLRLDGSRFRSPRATKHARWMRREARQRFHWEKASLAKELWEFCGSPRPNPTHVDAPVWEPLLNWFHFESDFADDFPAYVLDAEERTKWKEYLDKFIATEDHVENVKRLEARATATEGSRLATVEGILAPA